MIWLIEKVCSHWIISFLYWNDLVPQILHKFILCEFKPHFFNTSSTSWNFFEEQYQRFRKLGFFCNSRFGPAKAHECWHKVWHYSNLFSICNLCNQVLKNTMDDWSGYLLPFKWLISIFLLICMVRLFQLFFVFSITWLAWLCEFFRECCLWFTRVGLLIFVFWLSWFE